MALMANTIATALWTDSAAMLAGPCLQGAVVNAENPRPASLCPGVIRAAYRNRTDDLFITRSLSGSLVVVDSRVNR
jgi:hypothetical protein